jgi:predicted MFS family arabinose efflux permease
MTMPRDEATTVRRSVRHHRNSRLITLTALTLIGVTGHFISYTFIVVIIRDVVGVHGPRLAWLLAAFGIAGLISMAAMGRPLDRWPRWSAAWPHWH